MTETTLTEEGAIIVPEEIRQRLKIKPGDRIAFRILNDKTVIIHPAVDIRELGGMVDAKGVRLSDEEIEKVIKDRRIT